MHVKETFPVDMDLDNAEATATGNSDGFASTGNSHGFASTGEDGQGFTSTGDNKGLTSRAEESVSGNPVVANPEAGVIVIPSSLYSDN